MSKKSNGDEIETFCKEVGISKELAEKFSDAAVVFMRFVTGNMDAAQGAALMDFYRHLGGLERHAAAYRLQCAVFLGPKPKPKPKPARQAKPTPKRRAVKK
jgi:hypothetical protein